MGIARSWKVRGRMRGRMQAGCFLAASSSRSSSNSSAACQYARCQGNRGSAHSNTVHRKAHRHALPISYLKRSEHQCRKWGSWCEVEPQERQQVGLLKSFLSSFFPSDTKNKHTKQIHYILNYSVTHLNVIFMIWSSGWLRLRCKVPTCDTVPAFLCHCGLSAPLELWPWSKLLLCLFADITALFPLSVKTFISVRWNRLQRSLIKSSASWRDCFLWVSIHPQLFYDRRGFFVCLSLCGWRTVRGRLCLSATPSWLSYPCLSVLVSLRGGGLGSQQ